MSINGVAYRDSSAVKLLIAGLIIFGWLVVQAVMDLDVENNKRAQAFKQLDQIEYCFNQVDPYLGRTHKFKSCTGKMRTTFTGDVYILDPNTLEFLFDASRDAGREEPRYFTKESVGKYFKDWESGKAALDVILLGKNSNDSTRVKYSFDNAEEWLEWRYLEDSEGEMVVVQGIQSDEANARFRATRYVMLVGVIILVFGILVNVGLNNRAMRL